MYMYVHLPKPGNSRWIPFLLALVVFGFNWAHCLNGGERERQRKTKLTEYQFILYISLAYLHIISTWLRSLGLVVSIGIKHELQILLNMHKT